MSGAPPVLVVDDEADMRVSYERLLRRMGYAVVSVDCRRQGLDVIDTQPLTLVVADLKLRDGSGLDVVAAARSAARSVPAIVVTGFLSAESRRAAIEAGAAGFLAKPFTAADFVALVRRAIGDGG